MRLFSPPTIEALAQGVCRTPPVHQAGPHGPASIVMLRAEPEASPREALVPESGSAEEEPASTGDASAAPQHDVAGHCGERFA
jgi:hypothetical protein